MSTADDADDADADDGTAMPRAIVPSIVRPRVRGDHPLLWRSDGQVQVGIGERALRLGALTSTEMAWLTGIDGTRDWAQVNAHAVQLGIAAEPAARLLDALARAGALDDAGSMPDVLRWRDRPQRDAVAGDLAAAGIAYGSGVRANAVIDRRLSTRVTVRGTGVLADALRDALAVSGVVACDDSTPEADARIIAVPHPALMDSVEIADEAPHLPVAVFGDSGAIGPLVIPGRTGCLRCAHLHRRDADPCWPPLTLQLEQAIGRMRPGEHPTDRLLARATATAAVLLMRRWVDDPLATEAWADQVLEVHLPDGAILRRPAPPHALCGCRWPERAA